MDNDVYSLSGVFPPGSVVTETYILLGTFDNEQEARNCFSYVVTNFFDFSLLSGHPRRTSRVQLTHLCSPRFFAAVTDEKLYTKYGHIDDEVAYIERLIRPMGEDDGLNQIEDILASRPKARPSIYAYSITRGTCQIAQNRPDHARRKTARRQNS